MAPYIRSLKPSFFRHELLQELEEANPGKHIMLVFSALWGHCDKAGHFLWRPKQMRLDILPFLSFDLEETVNILAKAGMIGWYEVGGKLYGEIPTFSDHQRISGNEAMNPPRYPQNPNSGSTVEAVRKHSGSTVEALGKHSGSSDIDPQTDPTTTPQTQTAQGESPTGSTVEALGKQSGSTVEALWKHCGNTEGKGSKPSDGSEGSGFKKKIYKKNTTSEAEKGAGAHSASAVTPVPGLGKSLDAIAKRLKARQGNGSA